MTLPFLYKTYKVTLLDNGLVIVCQLIVSKKIYEVSCKGQSN